RLDGGDLNETANNTVAGLNSPPSTPYVNNPPGEPGAGYLFTYQLGVSPNARLQFYYGYNSKKMYSRSCNANGVWSEWELLDSIKAGREMDGGDLNDAPNNAVTALPSPPTTPYVNNPPGEPG